MITTAIPPVTMHPIPGVWLCRNANGIPVLQIRYWADPEKDETWAAEEKKKYTSSAYWNKEMLGDAYALDGQLVYPEFSPLIHVIPDEKIPRRGCRYMAIDPHPRTPHAFLWLLVDRYGDIYAYRELWESIVYGQNRLVKDTDEEKRWKIWEYAETVVRLEGNRLQWFNRETADEYAVIREGGPREIGMAATIDRHAALRAQSGARSGEVIIDRYMDQAGKAFEASDESALTESYSRRYAKYSIDCRDPRKSHQAGEDAIRDILKLRQHDQFGVWPRFHLAESLVELSLEFQRYRYRRSRGQSEEKELKQQGVEARCHLLDLLRYLVVADLAYIPKLES